MGHKMKKGIIGFLTAVMVFTTAVMVPDSGITAEAAVKYDFQRWSKNVTEFYVPNGYSAGETAMLEIKGNPKSSQIKNVKSSNNSIAKARAVPGGIRVYYYKKAGTANISCKIGGKTLKAKFTVRKYTNPVASLKIGGKELASRCNNERFIEYYHNGAIKNKEVIIKAKKGWRIVYVRCSGNGKVYRETNVNLKTTYKIKGVTFQKEYNDYSGIMDEVNVAYLNTKTNECIDVCMTLFRE